MFKPTAGEVMVNLLKEWKVDHLYGMPGDSINHFIEALRKEKDEVNFIQVRHEEVAALAAGAFAKLTGKLGVCLSIAGPGAIHLMNGLYDAKADGAPVLALVGQVERDKIGTDDFQELNLERVFDDVAVFNQRVATAEQLPDLLNQAIRTAYAEKGVAVLVLPDDLMATKIKKPDLSTAKFYTERPHAPNKEDLEQAVSLFNKAKKPVILAGKGALGAKKELKAFAEKLAAPVIQTLLGKGVLPDEDSYNLGHLGQIGTKPAYEAMEETDLLIMIGTSFPYRDFLPDNVTAIQIDRDSRQIGKRYPVNIGLVGDSKVTLQWLNDHVAPNADPAFLEACMEGRKKWWEAMEKEENEVSTPIKPQQVMPKLQAVLNDDAVLSCDVGNVTVWAARHLRLTHQKFVVSGWMATMGCGLPGALAAKVAYPERQVVAICGDGGFSMVMHDFVTAVRYNLPIMVVILNNEKLGMIKYEQEELGHLNYKTDLGSMDFAKFAEACGGEGFRIEQHDELEATLKHAASIQKPVIVDIAIDDQPPLPGKIEYGQAASYTKYMVKQFFENGQFDVPPIKKSLKRF